MNKTLPLVFLFFFLIPSLAFAGYTYFDEFNDNDYTGSWDSAITCGGVGGGGEGSTEESGLGYIDLNTHAPVPAAGATYCDVNIIMKDANAFTIDDLPTNIPYYFYNYISTSTDPGTTTGYSRASIKVTDTDDDEFIIAHEGYKYWFGGAMSDTVTDTNTLTLKKYDENTLSVWIGNVQTTTIDIENLKKDQLKLQFNAWAYVNKTGGAGGGAVRTKVYGYDVNFWYAPTDLNYIAINNNDFSDDLPVFTYTTDLNLLFDFNILYGGDIYDNNFLLDINYNSGQTEGGLPIYADANILDVNTFTCENTDFNVSTRCQFTWYVDNNSVNDGNYFIVAKLKDMANETLYYTEKSFRVDSAQDQNKCFHLVDEHTGAVFDLDDVNSLTVKSLDGNFAVNLKTTGNPNFCANLYEDSTLRFDINYFNGIMIHKNFSYDVLGSINDVNVCVAEPQVLYEQLILSGKVQFVTVVQTLLGCYNMADKTRYAYENSYAISAYTIPEPYNIYTNDDGEEITLGLIDGSKASIIRLDVLEFYQNQYNLIIAQEDLSVMKVPDTNTLKLYYLNHAEDNESITIYIYDGATQLWSYTDFNSPNELTAYFDYTGLTITNDLLTVQIVKTKTDGSTSTIEKYITLQGSTGILSPPLAVLIALVFFTIAFTLVSYKTAFNWFGIIVGLICLGLLSLAPAVWYVTFTQAIIIILTAFIGLVMKEENAGAIR